MDSQKLMNKEEAKVLLLYLLKKLNYVSEKYNIPVYASGGTCLGMVRHKGMIPWDDDIDVMIFRKDYDRIISAFEKELEKPLVIRTRENDPTFCQEFIKLCYLDDNGNYSDLSIDIFELDETDPERTRFRAIQNHILSRLYYIKMYKVSRMDGNTPYTPNNKWKKRYLRVMSFLPIRFIDKLHRKTMLAQKRSTPYVVNWGAAYSYKKATYPKEAFGTPQKMPFENTYVWAEEHPEMILKRLYGENYMTPPPPEKRTDHGVRKFTCSAIDIEKIRTELGL